MTARRAELSWGEDAFASDDAAGAELFGSPPLPVGADDDSQCTRAIPAAAASAMSAAHWADRNEQAEGITAGTEPETNSQINSKVRYDKIRGISRKKR